MVSIVQKPAFKKAYKKLHSTEKEEVNEAVRNIVRNPRIGELKKGDLNGLSVYKFKINKQEKLLAYIFSEIQIVLVGLGTQ